jgi:hypothetical protein
MASYPPFIPIAFGGAGDEVALIFTQDATGAQLALAAMTRWPCRITCPPWQNP